MLTRSDDLTYERLRKEFRWRLPARFNIGVDVSDRQPPEATAIIVTDGRKETRRVSFGELSEDSNRLANALGALGFRAGDRIGVLLPQRVETALAHIAIYKLGAIAVPLSVLFGPDALELRVRHSGARAVIGEGEALERLRELAPDLLLIDADRDLPRLLAQSSPVFEPVATEPDTPAIIIYTSGTTGQPKGALHGHRILLGHLPGFELSHDFFPQRGDVIWTPADWAWIGGLFDVLMPSLHHGRPVVCFRAGKFDPERAADLIGRLAVRNAFIPPTALRLMRAAGRVPHVSLRTLASGGEAVGEDLQEWSRARLGVPVIEFYGQTEANLTVGNCPSLWPVKAGWLGRPYPGHDVALRVGEICVRATGNPGVFLGYWNDAEATAEKVADGWLRTGDLAIAGDDASIRFVGRADDVIATAGYRVGPEEIEACLRTHPDVVLAAAVGRPDRIRGEVVKAFVVLRPGTEPTSELAGELKDLVKTRLAAYEYPRVVEFVSSLPTTTTGKIRRAELRRREAQRAARSGGEEAAAGTIGDGEASGIEFVLDR